MPALAVGFAQHRFIGSHRPFAAAGCKAGPARARALCGRATTQAVSQGAEHGELHALRTDNARLRQAVRERLAALSEERRHTVLQRHAELRALANGIEAIPSLDAEAAPEPLAKEAAAPTPAASAVAPGDAGPAAEGGSNAAEHALPSELANGADWAAIAKGEAEVMQGTDDTLTFSFGRDRMQTTAALPARAPARLGSGGDVGGGPELEPLQPEEPQPQPPQAQADGEADEPVDAEDAAGESYGAGQEHEPLKQQPSLARTPGASAAAAAAAGKRLRESSG